MNLKICFVFFLSLASEISQAANLWVTNPARLYNPNSLSTKTSNECAPQTLLAQKVIKELSKSFSDIQEWNEQVILDNKDSTPRLELTILSSNSTGGGGWSGAKMLLIKAELIQNDHVLSSFIKSRNSKGGVFAPIKGTCDLLDNITDTLARDIDAWIKKAGAIKNPAPKEASGPTAQQ